MMDKPTYHIIAIPDNPATLVPSEVLVGRVIGGRRVSPHVGMDRLSPPALPGQPQRRCPTPSSVLQRRQRLQPILRRHIEHPPVSRIFR
jgi:hypothetical protein